MADVHNKETRSYNMSRIRNKDTKPELIVRKYLYSHGFRYRVHVKNLAGKPDILVLKYNTVIFVNGCFWHGHQNCKFFKLPKSNVEFWENKIAGNIKRDEVSVRMLEESGFKVIKLWECQFKNAERRKEELEALVEKIING